MPTFAYRFAWVCAGAIAGAVLMASSASIAEPAQPAVRCAAFNVPLVVPDSRASEPWSTRPLGSPGLPSGPGSLGIELPHGWTPVGGGATNERPIVVACH